MGRVLLFDLIGWITLLAGALLALITLFTSYGHVDIPGLGPIPLNQQGLFRQSAVLLILASLATLVGDVELATRRRLRAERDRVRSERNRIQAERDRAPPLRATALERALESLFLQRD